MLRKHNTEFLPRGLAVALRGWAAACLAATLAAPVHAAAGRFEVINASSRLEEGAWFVDARVDLELSSEAIKALQSGVALRIIYQYEVSESRRFWPDEIIRKARQEFEVQYLSLSERYLIRRLGEDAQQSYATLFSALRYMGQVRDFRVIDDVLTDADETYYIAMRAVLDQEQLPGPLQIFAFWRNAFGLESEWYRWKLK